MATLLPPGVPRGVIIGATVAKPLQPSVIEPDFDSPLEYFLVYVPWLQWISSMTVKTYAKG